MTVAPPRPLGLLCFVLALALAACNAPPPPQPSFPEIRFADRPPIRLDVKRIEIEERYLPPLKAPNVEHLLPLSPAQAARAWGEDRLKAVGRYGVAKLVIEQASVVSEKLPVDKSFSGLFKKEQAEALVGVLRVKVEVPSEGGMRGGFAEATANARQTVPEEVTLNKRDEIGYGLTRELADTLDRELEAAIRQHLGVLVR